MINQTLPLRASMFWTPDHFGSVPPWFQHAPFAFWLIDTFRPVNFVELGTHAGFSYFCFCQAVAKLKTNTKCHAVDTWKGDEHAGFYDEGIYDSVLEINKGYPKFSHLLRATFDDALSKFPNKSIDLLHIDGRHFYQDVKHDYESWLPKLTDDAIVLFHDTNVRERDFGVWKLFKSLKKHHAGFEFLHGHGLGVLAPGKVPRTMKLFFAENPELLRQVFCALGLAISNSHRLRETAGELIQVKADLQEKISVGGQMEKSLMDESLNRAAIRQLQIENKRQSDEQKSLPELMADIVDRQNEPPSQTILAPAVETPALQSNVYEAIRKFNQQMNRQRPLLARAGKLVKSKLRPKATELQDIRNSVFFDEEWYLRTYPDVAAAGVDPAQHYWASGAKEGRDPGPLFSTTNFFVCYPELQISNLNPLVYLTNRTKKSNTTEVKKTWPTENRHAELTSYFSYHSTNFRPVSLLEDAAQIKSETKLVAFYLPQFHPIPENDEWWGKGFTEWTNVTRALPQFEGHYQPHLPGELGFYDLRNPDVQRRQSELANIYGVSAFCIYFYWFNGRILLEKPLLNLLENLDIKQDFCLCWANENWSRRWDGLDQELLIEQQYSPEDDIAFITHISTYLKDARYLKVTGKPVLIIYRPQLLPSFIETAKRWRAWCANNEVGEIYLVCTHSFGPIDPATFGCDAAVEFPPNGANKDDIKKSRVLLNQAYDGHVYDWSVFVKRIKSYSKSDYRLFRSVCPMWDNEARKPGKGNSFVNFSPAGYGEWLYQAILNTEKNVKVKDERLVFINAWNEWAEGAHLEPDRRHGYAYLEATRMALVRANILNNQRKVTANNTKLAVVIHVFYLDVFEMILDRLGQIDARAHIFVTTIDSHENNVRSILQSRNLDGTIFIHENRGRDVLPFLMALKEINAEEYPFVLKLHTKKSPHRSDGDKWCKDHLDCLATPEQVSWILDQMCHNTKIGLVGAKKHVVSMQTYMGSNLTMVQSLANRMGLPVEDITNDRFIAGTMFLARRDALEPMLNLAISANDFEDEDGQTDATTAHAIERAFAYSATAAALQIFSVGRHDAAKKTAPKNHMNKNFRFAKP